MVSLQRLHQLSWREWTFFTEAFFLSAYCRFLIHFVPLKKFATSMGEYGKESEPSKLKNSQELQTISAAIIRISRRVPWRCLCYEQAFIGKLMLNRRKIPATIYFGVANSEGNELMAHAWLRCGDTIITGKAGMGKFTTVAWFS